MSARIAVFTLLGSAVLVGVPAGDCAPDAHADETPSVGRLPKEAVTRLELDWLDDDVELPEAFTVNGGVVPPRGEARFRVLACTDDIRYYYDVTADFGRNRIPWDQGESPRPIGRLRISTHGLRKGRGALPEFRYDAEQDAIVYRPRVGTQFDRGATGTLDFRWKCRSPHLTCTTRFTLTVPPK